MKENIKTCDNCAYRKGSYIFYNCMLSGFYCTTERIHPSRCGKNFENWKQREDFWLVKLIKGCK